MASVTIIYGFLDAGKTTFIQEVLNKKSLAVSGNTLLVVCEDGEAEYDKEALALQNIDLVFLDEEERFQEETLTALETECKPERIIIEYNGMWKRHPECFPWYWDDIMEIAIIDAAVFPLYLMNMKSLVAEHVRGAELVIFRNCEDTKSLNTYRRNIKAVNQKANFIFRTAEGDVSPDLDEDLPYRLTDEVLELDDKGFVTFYLDSLERLELYLGKRIHFIGMVYKMKNVDENTFMAARTVMTCCEADLALFGIICKGVDLNRFAVHDWVKVEAIVKKQYYEEVERELPVAVVTGIALCEEPEEEIISL